MSNIYGYVTKEDLDSFDKKVREILVTSLKPVTASDKRLIELIVCSISNMHCEANLELLKKFKEDIEGLSRK